MPPLCLVDHRLEAGILAKLYEVRVILDMRDLKPAAPGHERRDELERGFGIIEAH